METETGKNRSAAFAAVALSSLACALFLWQMSRPGWGFDFRLRYNEIACLRAGIDPFLVWSGKASLPGLKPYTEEAAAVLPAAGEHPFVHSYTPWTYSLLAPFARLDYPVALACWRLALTVCFAALLFFAYRAARRVRGEPRDGLFALAAVAAFVALNVETGVALNFGLPLAVALCAMAWFLNRGRDLAAGACLAVLMVKPQVGALFTFPLLLRRKFSTLACGAALCLAGTLPTAALCHRSPLDLILQAPRAGAYTRRTTFFPGCVYAELAQRFGEAVPFVASAIAGAALCAWLCWRLRKTRDWLPVLAAPAAVCVSWTYSMTHDRVVLVLPVLLAVRALLRERSPGIRAALSALLLVLPLGFAYQYLCWIFPGVPVPVLRASFLWRSAHELLVLVLFSWLCLQSAGKEAAR